MSGDILQRGVEERASVSQVASHHRGGQGAITAYVRVDSECISCAPSGSNAARALQGSFMANVRSERLLPYRISLVPFVR